MPLTPEVSLVAHVENVTEGSVALANVFVQNYQTQVDFDVLIVSALLHDVSKLIEMEPGKEAIEKTKIGKTFQHGYFGAYMAQKYGLPDSIVTNILTHTGFSKTLPSTIEGIFLFYADMADSDAHRFEDGIALNILHHK
ncbi:HD domain-containing protein [Hominifimenecus sp. rT4P-3]|uniref:HD domain-containing protein n=1 Tax=Hominifimenecus sp. rT4P-3 TaxID=3242979 RepID=UPI003DA29E1B